jgi:CDP-diacylglycerol---glycerol-3-phosphate 3-phosphatidyltransferase
MYKKERLPNDITHVRFVMIPVFLLSFWAGTAWMPITLAIWWAAYVSDIADGYLARKWKCTSPYGALMDPLADKLIVLCAIFIGVAQGWFPLWLAILLEGRESIATAVRMTALEAKGLVISSGYWGKRKADSQMTGLTLMLAAQAPSNTMQWVLGIGAVALIAWCAYSKNWDVMAFAVIFGLALCVPTYLYSIGLAFLILSAVLSMISLIQYVIKLYRVLNPQVDHE